MPAVTRLGDQCSGHPPCYPARPNSGASPNVFCNGIPVHRQGDPWPPHGTGSCTPHPGTTAAGSSSVYVNGRQIARVGDPVDCGSTIAQGSNNVFAGG